jgi:hypothetical protein
VTINDGNMQVLGILPAPLNPDLYVIEGFDVERHVEWQAVISATDATTGTEVNSLSIATVLAAASHMLEALRAVHTATSLEVVREIAERAIAAATTVPDLSDLPDPFEPLVF